MRINPHVTYNQSFISQVPGIHGSNHYRPYSTVGFTIEIYTHTNEPNYCCSMVKYSSRVTNEKIDYVFQTSGKYKTSQKEKLKNSHQKKKKKRTVGGGREKRQTVNVFWWKKKITICDFLPKNKINNLIKPPSYLPMSRKTEKRKMLNDITVLQSAKSWLWKVLQSKWPNLSCKWYAKKVEKELIN